MIDFATVDARLRDATGRAFPAAQLIAVDHFSLVFERAVGDCDPETPFDIASLTKPLSTATLALMAIEAGLLALDDRPRSDVTVEQLLTHSSGLPAWKPLGA
ncbi:MAG TPA: serine hydrolase domain-containing protein, partial [Polyangia bacterium]